MLIPGPGRSTVEGIGYQLQNFLTLLVAQKVKNLLAMWESWVRSLGWEGPLEKGTSPGEEDDYPLQYSDLENSMDKGA